MKRWEEEKINAWYRELPYYAGANFVPSTASNQLEMWQAESFDPETIKKELTWAKGLGMNLMRVFLHDLLWEQDSQAFLSRIDEYLSIAAELGIKTSFVFFDDCWNPESQLGPQPEPIPYTHNSRWLQSPGIKVAQDPSEWGRLEVYVKAVLEHFKADERILYWDLYNEPGNGPGGDPTGEGTIQGERSLPLLEKAFEWARSIEALTQPLTVCIWNEGKKFKGITDFAYRNSDLLSFHSYDPAFLLKRKIRKYRKQGRPLFCTEYMARPYSTFRKCLPVLKKMNVPALNWGLVAGRSNTIYPWQWSEAKGTPKRFFHDVFQKDGSMLYEKEREQIQKILL